MPRTGNRKPEQLRQISFTPDFQRFPAGSVLVSFGNTRVVCAVTMEEKVPPFLKDSGHGWVTAEYAMLPGATGTRNAREAVSGRQKGRSIEIQRLIGRSLRSVVDRRKLGERTLLLDCDVLQADGGTRTAAITGAFVAISLAVKKLLLEGKLPENPIIDHVAAVSVGLSAGETLLDLDYEEDSRADVDLNLVATGSGSIIEVQGTAEGEPFSRENLDRMMDLGLSGIAELVLMQQQALARR